MAIGGARTKLAALRVVDGTHRNTRHGEVDDAKKMVKKERKAFGKPKMPGHLGEIGKEAWRDYIEPAYWLTKARQVSAICFCELYEQFREDPKAFNGARHAQLRSYMADLGLTDERKRSMDGSQEAEDTDEHFGD